MSAKRSKAKDKKAARKALVDALNARKKLIDDAYLVENHLDFVPLFTTYKKNGLDLTLKYFTAKDLYANDELFEWAFRLTKVNMEDLYNNAWGWNDKHKVDEMKEDQALYIIAFDNSTTKPVGFFHFRFQQDDEKDTEICYLYEIQVEAELQGKGLGAFFMVILQIIAKKNAMKFVLLTVFKGNTGAMKFYRNKMNYSVDETSPSMSTVDITDPASHEVLSKKL
eukprot:TRINITY_DN9159_c0_g1_i1.p1 TRINITY_DN9159_c0_g1~~TRINITY_DN9159_c0_g1_i1.p1  ORF type:complete len:224 (-),score=60.10 TRINITY_DN9159_c0_g1_i1:141-812(-)